MQFRTTFHISESEFKINHQKNILTLGSCFSDEIGNRLVDLKFKGLINPFGIVFNTHSIQNLIERSLNKKYYTIDDVHQNGEQFFCFDVHSSFNSLSANQLLNQINQTIDEVHQQLINCDVLILTLGTSWVYRYKETHQIVANCHKVEAKKFDKILLTTDDNFKALDLLIVDVLKVNPKLKIITTVSPVRHIKDGMVENNVSKARLIDALYQLNQKYKQVDYFPSYELVMDDLRDYRFFKTDLIHPTQQAVDYIWEHFVATYFTQQTITINQKINKIISALNHRPFNEDSPSHKTFLTKVLLWIDELEKSENLNFSPEKLFIQSKIKSC